MKDIYRLIFNIINTVKVLCLILAAAYFVFWFYRFFSLLGAQEISAFFDILVMPIHATVGDTIHISEENGGIAEMAYLIIGGIFIAFAIICHLLEGCVVEFNRTSDLNALKKRQELQNRVNQELKQEHIKSLLRYNYFSALIRFKVAYASEVTAMSGEFPPAQILDESYFDVANLIKRKVPQLKVIKYNDSVFVSGSLQETFDYVIDAFISSIKYVKNQNAQNKVRTDFSIVLDAQVDKASSENSLRELVRVADMEYYNKAVTTLAFKVRFDLMQEKSRYQTDVLGWSVAKSGAKNHNEEIFLFRTKPLTIRN